MDFPKGKKDVFMYRYIPNESIELLFCYMKDNSLLYFNEHGEAVPWNMPKDVLKALKNCPITLLYSDSERLLIQVNVKKQTFIIELDNELNYVRHLEIPYLQAFQRAYIDADVRLEKAVMQDGILTLIISSHKDRDAVYSPTLTPLNVDYFTLQTLMKYHIYRIDMNAFQIITSKVLTSHNIRCSMKNIADQRICFSPDNQLFAISVRGSSFYVDVFGIDGNSRGRFTLADTRFTDVYGTLDLQNDGTFTCYGYTQENNDLTFRTVRNGKIVREQSISINWDSYFLLSNIVSVERYNNQYTFLCYGKRAEGESMIPTESLIIFNTIDNTADTWILKNVKCNNFINIHANINPAFVFTRDNFYQYDAAKDYDSYYHANYPILIGNMTNKNDFHTSKLRRIEGIIYIKEETNTVYFKTLETSHNTRSIIYVNGAEYKETVVNGIPYIQNGKLICVGYKNVTISQLY